MGGIIPCCYNNGKTQKSLIKQETIKLPETGDDTLDQYNKKISIVEKSNPTQLQPPQKRTLSSNFLQAKINNIKINNPSNTNDNRRKSFSIAINPETLKVKARNRSNSTFNLELIRDITNLHMKKAYKILPNQNNDKDKDKDDDKANFAKSLSLISVDTITSINSPEIKKKKPIEYINEPFTEKQLRVLKKILSKEGLIIDDMDESTM